MKQDFNTLNKQIAAFIVVSSAFSLPVCAEGTFMADMPLAPFNGHEVIDRYAGPVMPTMGIQLGNPPATIKYAGPEMRPEINNITPEIKAGQSIIARYAGPMVPEVTSDKKFSVLKFKSNAATQTKNAVDASDAEQVQGFGADKIAPGHFIFK